MTWPGPNPGRAAATFDERDGLHPNLATDGPWAWFRLVDQSHVKRESDAVFLMTFERSNHESSIRVETESVLNPYGNRLVQQFRCE
jgi:type VI secretion system protein ImpL